MDPKDTYEKLFRVALRIRLVEERIIELYPDDKIQSPVHLSIGQEAVAVGACHPLRQGDWVFGSYRSHAFYLAKGGGMREMFAELYGKSGGGAKGKAGSMHLTAPEVGVMGSSAVVASTIPHAVGAALAAKRKGDDQVVMSVFGDGATEEGVYHESLNFASLHQLPVILLCENNGLAIHAHLEDRQAYRIAEHAASYRMPVTVAGDGYDFVKLAEMFDGIVAAVRGGGGPHFVEVETYRSREHVGPGEDFDDGYRSRDGLAAWEAKDPLVQDKALADVLRAEIEAEIDDAVAFAEASPWPGPDQLLEDVI